MCRMLPSFGGRLHLHWSRGNDVLVLCNGVVIFFCGSHRTRGRRTWSTNSQRTTFPRLRINAGLGIRRLLPPQPVHPVPYAGSFASLASIPEQQGDANRATATAQSWKTSSNRATNQSWMSVTGADGGHLLCGATTGTTLAATTIRSGAATTITGAATTVGGAGATVTSSSATVRVPGGASSTTLQHPKDPKFQQTDGLLPKKTRFQTGPSQTLPSTFRNMMQ